MTLTTHHLAFTATALTPVALGEQSGSAVRGALAGALWERFCTNKTAPACVGCPLTNVCTTSMPQSDNDCTGPRAWARAQHLDVCCASTLRQVAPDDLLWRKISSNCLN